jgi:hypothetical protein
MLSDDGKCFAFDSRANGLVPGEAVAVVVLKKLSRAELEGDPVYAVAKGKVIYSGYDKLNGNKVVIKHNDGTKTYYIHLDKRLVKKGNTVVARQQIAKLGRTGRVTGPHLHFGIKSNKGKWVNPLLKRMIATPKLEDERYARFLTQMEEIDQKVQDFKEKNKLFTLTSL